MINIGFKMRYEPFQWCGVKVPRVEQADFPG
jgi:hypothetical protein